MTEKACSTGFKSGEYGGKYSIRQPRDKGKSKVETKPYKTRFTHQNSQQVQIHHHGGEFEHCPSLRHFEDQDTV